MDELLSEEHKLIREIPRMGEKRYITNIEEVDNKLLFPNKY